MHATQHFPPSSKDSLESSCAICNNFSESGSATLHYIKTKAKNCLEQRVAISNQAPRYSVTFDKNNKKETLTMFDCWYILYINCNDSMLVSITMISDKHYEKMLCKTKGYECVKRLRTTSINSTCTLRNASR